MISESAVHGVTGAVYAVSLAVLLARLRNVSGRARRFCSLATLVVAIGAVASALMAAGVGTVAVGGRPVTLPSFVADLVAYPILWAVTALLAGVDRRTLAVVTGLPFVQVLSFQVTASTGGVVSLVASGVVIGGHLVLLVLFRGRIWEATASLPGERRLLHWKARNLLLFLIGMLIVFAFLSLAGLFDAFGTVVLNQYVSVLIRVGFAAFLFANADALGDGGTQRDAPGASHSAAG